MLVIIMRIIHIRTLMQYILTCKNKKIRGFRKKNKTELPIFNAKWTENIDKWCFLCLIRMKNEGF